VFSFNSHEPLISRKPRSPPPAATTSAPTEILQAGNGQRLLNSRVDQLIQTMAAFSAQTGLTWDQAIDQRPTDVQTILAASWR